MSEKKKISEMTFKEFSARPKSREVRKEILKLLIEEGFAEKQLDEMNMERVWKLYLDSFATEVDKDITSLCDLVEKTPQAAPLVSHVVKRLTKEFEEAIKELEEKLEEEEKRAKEKSS